MEEEDVIELGSSDEEPGPPPKKMKTVPTNAMVHIPSKLHGVTIKPVRAESSTIPKLFPGKNITVTKITSAEATNRNKGIKSAFPVNRLVNKATAKVTKRKVIRKPNVIPTKGTVLNPLCHIKKIIPQSAGIPIGRLKNPIKILGPPALQKLPPSVTVKKTGVTTTSARSKTNLPVFTRPVPKQNSIAKKRNLPLMPTVELDDEEVSASTDSPQWYMTPEQTENSDHEKTNNKEPETPKYIEITIEDSPIKPPQTKRTRELSTENVITIDDSPNKAGTINADEDEGSDDEPNTSNKVPKSKKKLKYQEHHLETIQETRTLEIEIDPIAVEESNIVPVKENKIVSLTSDILEVQESSVEIAQNKQGDVSVVQIKSTQPDINTTTLSKDDEKNDFHPSYMSFIELCLQLENSEDMEKIVEKKIKTYYRQVPREYTQSEEFIDMVSSKMSAIKAAPEKMYLYIKDIVDELNLQRKMVKQIPVQTVKSKDEDTFSFEKSEFEPSKQRQIRKLEKTLKKLNRAIQKLEMQEVDFEDEEDSVYLLTEKYKERMVRVHAKFCQLTNSKMPSEPRLVLEPRPGRDPRPARRLEAWINKKKELAFPDFHDVLRCVREANADDKLGWNEAFIMEEARDLFVRCGKKLQRRRQEKEWRLATSRLTVNDDPAEKSDDLKKKLDDNRRLASTKETDVLNKFSDKQNLLKLEGEEIDDKDAEESPDESEEEDNDESSLESKQKRKDRLRRLLQEQAKRTSTNKSPKNEEPSIEEKENVINSTDGKKEALQVEKSNDDENVIQSLSDDSNEIGSDVDELHLLQKLHSDNEIHDISTSESSDSETPVAISDTLESSSDESSKKEPSCDIISIENSSYSDDSNSSQNSKKQNAFSINVEEESIEIETVQSKNLGADLVDNTSIFSDSSAGMPNATNTKKSEECIQLTKDSSQKDDKVTSDKDFEISIMSESSELCIEVNDLENPGEDKDESRKKSNETDINKDTSGGINEECDETSVKLCDSKIMEGDSCDVTLKDSTSKTCEELDPSEKHSKDSAEKTEQSVVSCDLVKNDSNSNPSMSEKHMNIEEDNSNVRTVVVNEECKDSTEASDVARIEDVSMNSIDESLTSDQVYSGFTPVNEVEDGESLLKEIDLPGTSKTWPNFRDQSESSSIKSMGDEDINEKSESDKINAPIDLLEGTIVSQNSDGSMELKENNSAQAMEISNSILITNIVSMRQLVQTDEQPQEDGSPSQNTEDSSDYGSEMITNGNSMDLPDLLQTGPSFSENNVDEKDDSSSNDHSQNGPDGLPILERSVSSVEKILDDMFMSEISAVDGPITLTPT